MIISTPETAPTSSNPADTTPARRNGSGTIDDPYRPIDSYGYTFDTFEAGFLTTFVPAHESSTGEQFGNHICLGVDFRATGADVEPATIAERVRLIDPDTGPLIPSGVDDPWPDMFPHGRLYDMGTISPPHFYTGHLCAPIQRDEPPTAPYLVTVDGEYYTLTR